MQPVATNAATGCCSPQNNYTVIALFSSCKIYFQFFYSPRWEPWSITKLPVLGDSQDSNQANESAPIDPSTTKQWFLRPTKISDRFQSSEIVTLAAR